MRQVCGGGLDLDNEMRHSEEKKRRISAHYDDGANVMQMLLPPAIGVETVSVDSPHKISY